MNSTIPLESIQVLYVDDDAVLVHLVQKVLGRQGFAVSHATNAEQALKSIAEKNFDVIALDHYLAEGTGIDFLKELKNTTAAPAVVYVTGSAEMDVAVTALKAGAADFVPKAVGEDFLVLLASALSQSVSKKRLQKQKDLADQAVRIALDRAEVLLSEVNHRVANSLSLLSSLIGLQSAAAPEHAVKHALVQTQARIHAIGLVHKHLYSSGDVRRVELKQYLGALIDQLQGSLQIERQGLVITYDLEPLKLPTTISVNLGVILSEWVTNAFKYAYPGGDGEIHVGLILLPDNNVELTVADHGVGQATENQVRGTGIGTRIVKAMATSIGGEISYFPNNPGTMARLVFPIPPSELA